MGPEVIQLAIPSDDAYWKYAMITACSAVKACSLPVVIHLIDGGVRDDHWAEFCNVVQKCNPQTQCIRHSYVADERLPEWHGSRITWSRLFLHEILPELDWVISADADIMFFGDCAALWNLRDEHYLIQPSKDRPLPWMKWNERAIAWHAENECAIREPDRYFCVGLCLLNLKGLRTESSYDPIGFLRLHPNPIFPDQSVLNYLLQGRQNILPNEWGAFSGDDNRAIDCSHPFALHFVSDAPWKRTKVTQLISDSVLAWHRLARELGVEIHVAGWLWRRLLYVFLRDNPRLWQWNSMLKFHFRNAVHWMS